MIGEEEREAGERGREEEKGEFFFFFFFFANYPFAGMLHVFLLFFDTTRRIDPISIPNSSAHSLGQISVRSDLGRERFNAAVAQRGLGRSAIFDDVEAEVDEQKAERRGGGQSDGQGQRDRRGGCDWRGSRGGEEAHSYQAG